MSNPKQAFGILEGIDSSFIYKPKTPHNSVKMTTPAKKILPRMEVMNIMELDWSKLSVEKGPNDPKRFLARYDGKRTMFMLCDVYALMGPYIPQEKKGDEIPVYSMTFGFPGTVWDATSKSWKKRVSPGVFVDVDPYVAKVYDTMNNLFMHLADLVTQSHDPEFTQETKLWKPIRYPVKAPAEEREWGWHTQLCNFSRMLVNKEGKEYPSGGPKRPEGVTHHHATTFELVENQPDGSQTIRALSLSEFWEIGHLCRGHVIFPIEDLYKSNLGVSQKDHPHRFIITQPGSPRPTGSTIVIPKTLSIPGIKDVSLLASAPKPPREQSKIPLMYEEEGAEADKATLPPSPKRVHEMSEEE
jgi:hypothetical protein